jgi:hypothetical protein
LEKEGPGKSYRIKLPNFESENDRFRKMDAAAEIVDASHPVIHRKSCEFDGLDRGEFE